MKEFEDLIRSIHNDEFRNPQIQISADGQEDFDKDLQGLESALRGNKWCKDNVKNIMLFNSNVRVPVNIMPYNLLPWLYLIDSHPLTPLGQYALLLMKFSKKEKLVLNGVRGKNLDREFASENQKKDKKEKTIEDFIDEFNIPPEFFAAQVVAVEEYMDKIYSAVPASEITVDEANITYFTIPEVDCSSNIQLHNMNQDYSNAIGILRSIIDGLHASKKNTKNSESDGIIPIAMEKIAAFGITFNEHQKFFLDTLYADFTRLYQIFVAVNKPLHAAAVNAYVKENGDSWPALFNSKIRHKLTEAGKTYLSGLNSELDSRPREKLRYN